MPPTRTKLHLTPETATTDSTATRLAASLARKSTPDEAAVEDQHVTNAQRAKADGWEIPDRPGFRFGDDNTKGSLTNRAGLNALLEVIESGEAPFSRVYVRHRDRLARATDPRFIFWFEYHCKMHGVQVCYSVDETHVNYDGTDAGNQIGTFVTSAVENVRTAEEVRILKERINIGVRRKVKCGAWPGAWVPFGTERWLGAGASRETVLFIRRLEHGERVRQAGCAYWLRWNDDETPVVRRIYAAIEAGHSLRAVAKQLNTDGVPSPGARRAGGGTTDPWLPGDVWAIAREPLYCGDLVWGRETYRDPARHVHHLQAEFTDRGAIVYPRYLPDAPVTLEQWQAVQRILDGNAAKQVTRRASRPEYLLTGLARCSACGQVLTGHTSTRVKHGQRVRYYRHLPARKHGAPACPHAERYIAATALEGPAADTVTQTLESETLVKLVKQELKRLLADHGAAEREREAKTVRRTADRLTHALNHATRFASVASTDVERASYRRQAEQFGRELEAAQVRLQQLEAAGAQLRGVEERLADVQRWADDLRPQFHAGRPGDRKRIVAALLDSLQVDFAADALEVRVRTLPAA